MLKDRAQDICASSICLARDNETDKSTTDAVVQSLLRHHFLLLGNTSIAKQAITGPMSDVTNMMSSGGERILVCKYKVQSRFRISLARR
jgi:hypothetical protein